VARIVASLVRGVVPEGQRALGSHIPDEGQPLAALIERLRAARADLLTRVRGWPASPDLAATFEHPFFGPLNCKGWMAFQRLHDADHIGPLEQIKAAPGYPGAHTSLGPTFPAEGGSASGGRSALGGAKASPLRLGRGAIPLDGRRSTRQGLRNKVGLEKRRYLMHHLRAGLVSWAG
jgi:hypothetical protein